VVCTGVPNRLGTFLAVTAGMSRAASPAVKIGLMLAVLLITGARVLGSDVPTCTREIARCLSACRAVCARRITENERRAKSAVQGTGSADAISPPLASAGLSR
jgi:hypothetical protein